MTVAPTTMNGAMLQKGPVGSTDCSGRHGLPRDRMPWVTKLLRQRLLPVVAPLVLTAACRGATVEAPITYSCSDLIRIEPLGYEIVVPVGGSQRIRVQIRKQSDREKQRYQDCSRLSVARLSWLIDDPSIARIEEYSAAVWTITGLAAGETWIRLRHDVPRIEISKPLKVVQS